MIDQLLWRPPLVALPGAHGGTRLHENLYALWIGSHLALDSALDACFILISSLQISGSDGRLSDFKLRL